MKKYVVTPNMGTTESSTWREVDAPPRRLDYPREIYVPFLCTILFPDGLVRAYTERNVWNQATAAVSRRPDADKYTISALGRLPEGWYRPEPQDEEEEDEVLDRLEAATEALEDKLDVKNITGPGFDEPAPVAGKTIHRHKAEGIAQLQANLNNDGWAVNLTDKTWYPPGTEMLESGKQVARNRSLEVSKLPMALAEKDGLPALIRMVSGEQRNLVNADVANISYEPGIMKVNGKHYAVEPRCLWQFLSRHHKVVPFSEPCIRACSPDTIATYVNDALARYRRFPTSGKGKEARQFQFGTRIIDGIPQLYRANSRKYLPMDAHIVAHAHIEELKRRGIKDVHVDWSYNQETGDATIALRYAAPPDFDFAVGDPIEFGTKVSTNDAGWRSYRHGGFIVQIICINCTMTAHPAGDKQKAMRHSSSYSTTKRAADIKAYRKVIAAVRSDMDHLESGARTIGEYWGILKQKPLALYGKTPGEALAALAKGSPMEKALSAAALPQVLLDAYNKQPGDSVYDGINAITRAAHESRFLNQLEQFETEEYVGRELLPALALSPA